MKMLHEIIYLVILGLLKGIPSGVTGQGSERGPVEFGMTLF